MRKKPFVTTLSLATLMGVLACNKQNTNGEEPLPGNPPAPEPVVMRNPPGPELSLPTWDEVPSNHPEGATNPPIPLLAVDADGNCYKEWYDPRAYPEHARESGRRQITAEAPAQGTLVQCPPEKEPTP